VQEPVQGASDLALRPSMASPTRIRAGLSEVLVSQTVRDLVAGSGLTFEDVDEHEEWHPPTADTSTGW
jgi:hypothetical protein